MTTNHQQVSQAIQAGHFEAAIAQLVPLLEADPNQPQLWQAKAVALLSLGQTAAAIVAAEQAIRLQPSLASAHRLMGKARSQLADKPGAIAAYKQATRCYLERQDKTNAQACLDQIEALRVPNTPTRSLISPQAFLAQVTAKMQRGRYSEALEDLNWLLQFEPNHVDALAQRGLLHAQCRNYPMAVSDFAQAITLAPDKPELRLQRGEMRLTLGDAHGAINDFSDLLKIETVDPVQVYHLRGQAYQTLDDSENAFKDFSNALGMDPNNAACYEARGRIYEAMEDWQEALANYRQAASLYLNQGNWSAHQNLQGHLRTLEAQITAQKKESDRIIRVPIKYLNGGTPVIQVIFNGHYPCDMVLDTGAGMTMLTQRMGDLLNIRSIGSRPFRMADGRIVEHPVGYVNSLAVGRARIEHLEVAISPTAPEGALGQNYLWRYDIRILPTEVELYLR